ncbi:MAG: hypothetical protein AAF125_13565 [Chloroflexota bacterium]
MADIPPRDPVGDLFDGVLLRYATATILARAFLPGTELIAEGRFTVRYGLRYTEKPGVSIVPGLLALDYGAMMTGEEMWDFLLARYGQYPRSEVFGFTNAGKDDMVVLKRLDFAAPLAVLVFGEDVATVPIGEATVLVTDAPGDLPGRLREAVPVFPSIDAWMEAGNE